MTWNTWNGVANGTKKPHIGGELWCDLDSNHFFPQESRGCLTSKNALGSQQNSENFRTPAKRIQKGIYKAFIHMIMYIYFFFISIYMYI